ncbi:MAG: phosphoglycerate dehydrogenase, partial [Thermoanaerobacterium sp.]|nr:phosphoglycerate dehydrogenase [Thermoanaerobacterium sp.]
MSKYKVVITARSFGESSDEPFNILKGNDCEVVKIPVDRPLSAEELIPLVKDADALIVGNDKVTEDVINAGKKLKVISRYGVGYDNVDLNAAKKKGIVVTNTPNANNNSVADLVIGLMLVLARNLLAVDRIVKSGGWKRIMGTEIYGKTLGIVGYGRIGEAVARRARGFNMKVLYYDARRRPAAEEAQQGIEYRELDDLLREADFVSLHVNLDASTYHLIGERQLSLMKPTAYLINTSRGPVVDEKALVAALRAGQIAGAGLDVFENEPAMAPGLAELPNVVVLPHIASASIET